MDEIEKLPSDVKRKIISYVDLETRQKAGIILKLCISQDIQNRLKNVFQQNIVHSRYKSYLKLGKNTYCLLRHFKDSSTIYYTVICRNKNNINKNIKSFERITCFDTI